MTAITPRIRLPWAAVRVPLVVAVGLLLAVAAALTITFLAIRPAPAQTAPAHPLPLHSINDPCNGAMPGDEC